MIDVHGLMKELSTFSSGGPGTTRLAYGKEYQEARKVIIREMEKLGMYVSQDEMGNLFGRLPGSELNALPVAVGSHIDTVPQGGDYDGVVGVVAALAVVDQIQAEGGCKHPLEVIVFAAEESSRFNTATMGSRAIAGKWDMEEWLKLKDKDGMTLKEVLLENGLNPDNLKTVPRGKGEWKAFLELHIEQGPVLEREELSIGVVNGIAGPTRMKIRICGWADHSGATPMEGRRDALVTASFVIQAIERAAVAESHHNTVATVGNVIVSPGVMNVIPGEVELWVDLRGIDKESIQRTFQEIKDSTNAICQERDNSAKIEMLSATDPVAVDPHIMKILSWAAEEAGASYRVMPSGAGHDAMYMAELAPTGMIFIPCKGGISHNPDEYSTPEQIDVGIQVLKHAVLRLAQ